MDQDEIDALLNSNKNNLQAGKEPQMDQSSGAQNNQTPEMVKQPEQITEINGNIEFLLDVPLEVSVELGRASIPIRELMQLGPGSVIELDKLIGEPVDLLVNNNLIAKGEVVVFDENFGIRITSIVTPSERIRSLR